MTKTRQPTTAAAPGASPAGAMLLAVAAVVGLRVWSYGRLLLYPLTLFSTWVHEMGHGVTAILVGGSFDRLEIFADASGLAHSHYPNGIAAALVALGGLLAPPLVGCGLLLISHHAKLARAMIYFLIASIGVSLVLWVRTAVGAVLLTPLSLLLWLVARRLSHGAGLFVLQLLGFALALDTISGLDYLFVDEVTINGAKRTSDIGSVARSLGGPTIVWSVVVAGGSLLLVALTGYIALRRASRLVPAE